MDIQLYNGVKDNVGNTITIDAAIQTITGPSLKPYAKLSTVYRQYLDETDEAKKKELKRRYDAGKTNLPAVTWSGSFSKRNAKSLIAYTQIICLDIDGLTAINFKEQLLCILCEDEYAHVVFTSPSGCGVKILVQVSTPAKYHKEVFNELAAYYKKLLGVDIDPSGKDVCRLCFLCYDENLFYNKKASLYIPILPRLEDTVITQKIEDKRNAKLTKPQQAALNDTGEDLYSVIAFTDKIKTYTEGNHNNYIHLFACNANRKGFSLAETMGFGVLHFNNKAQAEVEATIKSAYAANAHEHEKFKKTKHTTGNANTKVSPKVKNTQASELEPKTTNGIPKGSNTKFWDVGNDTIFTQFWQERTITKGKGEEKYSFIVYEIKFVELSRFLYEQGFHLRETNADGWQLCHSKNGIIKTQTSTDVAQFLIQFTKQHCNIEVQEMVRKNQSKIFTENELRALDYNNVEIKRDTENESFFYFNNCWVSVKKAESDTDKEVTTHKYDTLKEYIWATNKNKKDFTYTPSVYTCPTTDKFGVEFFTCEFAKFVFYASYNPKDVDEQHFTPVQIFDRFQSFMCAIGYMLDGYKHPSNRKAIFALDHKVGDKYEKNGRSGKSIIPMACSFLKKACTINGKTFDPRYPFRYEPITADAQILNLNDMKQSFDVEEIFEVIADDYSVLRRNNGYLFFPYESSPKVWYSANGVPKGEGGSYRARMHTLEFSDFFNPEYTPYDHFGHGFFSSVWNDTGEWDRFFSFLLDCVAAYKTNGLMPYPNSNIDARRFSMTSNIEFLETMEDMPMDIKFDKKPHYESYKKLLKENESKANSSAAFFKKSIELYCKAKGLFFVHTKTVDGKQKEDKSNGTTYYTIFTKKPTEQGEMFPETL